MGVASQPAPIAGEPPSQVDRSFDIASALGGLDALDSDARPPAEVPQGQQQISVETVFEQFKAGVAAQISESDAATHYDLGVAYKEMGLFSDSIAEFELASRDPTRACVAQSMIGMMNMEHGNIDQAIDAFLRGLASSHKSAEQEMALTYEIGNAYEIRGNRDQALYYFQLVARLDPNYRDMRGSVEERVANLSEPEPAQPAPTRAAAGADDEFDAVFDDLFEGKKRN
jgi:tetratricopeptide (TPR) repeat protein